MLTSFGDDEALFDAIVAGAAGYVLKQIRGTNLVGAVRTVASASRCSKLAGGEPADGPAAGSVATTIRWPGCPRRSAGSWS